MGRTLHFKINKQSSFTKKEKLIMHKHSLHYNSGDYADVWTCENYFLSPYESFYPNWTFFKQGAEHAWGVINHHMEKMEKEGLDIEQRIKELKKRKWIAWSDITNNLSGFCKVQGNEFNAALVYEALVSLSILLPTSTIKLHDEGNYLLCDVFIQKGKVKPDLDNCLDNMKSWAWKTIMGDKLAKDFKKKISIPEELDKNLGMDLGLTNGYGDSLVKYINLEIKKVIEIQNSIRKEFKEQAISKKFGSLPMCFHNIANYWYSPSLFIRPIKAQDFENYKMSAATLMGGFSGEYWKLDPDHDDEKTSYESIARMTSLIGNIPDTNLEILGHA